MAENDDYLDSMDNNHLEGTNGSINMTDNSLGVSSKVRLCQRCTISCCSYRINPTTII